MKRKNPYSLVNVNEVSIEALCGVHAGEKAAVGVDVAKGELVMCVVWPNREFERPWRVKSPGELRLTTACVLWTCLGDPQRYGSAGAYRKAMGLNLTERSSGQYKGRLKLSKRGQRLSRKWMYFAALRWMRYPSVKQWLQRKKERDGGRGGKAATGIMRRLAAAAWHAGQGEVFDPKRLFPGPICVVAS